MTKQQEIPDVVFLRVFCDLHKDVVSEHDQSWLLAIADNLAALITERVNRNARWKEMLAEYLELADRAEREGAVFIALRLREITEGLPAADAQDERDPQCVTRWPDCRSGDHDPRCCRFPKSCSPFAQDEGVQR